MALCFSGRKMCVKILKTLERKELAPQGDDLRTFLSDFVAALSDSKLVGRIRAWDYGSRGEHFVCWTVLQHHPSNTGIAYCLQGFGPSYPWGLVSLSGSHMNIAMDSSWFASLEDAMRNSMAWDGPDREGYEVQ
jgi:hypothetical protein